LRVDAFGIRRLGKKIGDWEIPQASSKDQNFIFLPSLRIPAEQLPNASTRHLVSIHENRFLPTIIGNESKLLEKTLILTEIDNKKKT
jgi:hypothetical protein